MVNIGHLVRMVRAYEEKKVKKVKKFRILILIGIITASSIGIIVIFSTFFPPHSLTEHTDSIISLAVGGTVTGFLSYYQSKDEIKKTELLKQINRITKVQEQINLSLIRGPLIGISIEIGKLRKKLKDGLDLAAVDNIDKLQCFHNENENCFKSTCCKIRSDANNIRDFVGEIYPEIVTTISNMDFIHNAKPEIIKEWKNDCEKAIQGADVLRDHIDDLLFLQLEPKDFDRVEVSTALKSNCIIVVGSKKERDKSNGLGLLKEADDYPLAVSLKKYNSKGFVIKKDRELLLNQEKLLENNLILIGGPIINALTHDLSRFLPLQYVQIGGSDNFFSRISGEIYSGIEYAVLQAIRNPYADDKVIVIAFGSDLKGTTRVINVLIDIIIGKIKEEELNNKIISILTNINSLTHIPQ